MKAQNYEDNAQKQQPKNKSERSFRLFEMISLLRCATCCWPVRLKLTYGLSL